MSSGKSILRSTISPTVRNTRERKTFETASFLLDTCATLVLHDTSSVGLCETASVEDNTSLG